jgi:hypothetical protein
VSISYKLASGLTLLTAAITASFLHSATSRVGFGLGFGFHLTAATHLLHERFLLPLTKI